ncbi:hypothetical protein D6825_01265 [Candidatus Woesearchaeota archaeon]|nr:MAG: hypothetical protein D6825_01265 [Candidatus Woesearchaeota archaeon]
MPDETLEKRVRGNEASDFEDGLDLGRIALTTIGYGLAGSLFPNPSITAPAGAAIGCIASVYDEAAKRGLDLFTPAVGGIIGGFVGSFFEVPYLNDIVPHLTVYVGALIGGSLGAYNSLRESENP